MPSLSSPAEIASSVSNTTAENPVAFTENFAKISQWGGATGQLSMKLDVARPKRQKRNRIKNARV
jgi:hypothetical protein